jgi:hypothetical protein
LSIVDQRKLRELVGISRNLDFDALLKETVDRFGWWEASVIERYIAAHPLAYKAKTSDVQRSTSDSINS